MIPEGEVGCKICEKSIYRIFVEHIERHLKDEKKIQKASHCCIPDAEYFKDKQGSIVAICKEHGMEHHHDIKALMTRELNPDWINRKKKDV